MEDKRTGVIFYAVLAVPLGVIGLVGAVLWLFRNRQAPVGAGLGNLGPAILGLAGIVMVIWGIVVIVGYRKIAKEEDQQF